MTPPQRPRKQAVVCRVCKTPILANRATILLERFEEHMAAEHGIDL